MASGHSIATFVSLVVAVVFYLRSPAPDHKSALSLEAVRDGLLAEERMASVVDKQVAVAFGGCLDVFVDAVDLFDKMGWQPPKKSQHFSTIKSQTEMEQLFAYFFQHGAAAERYVKNKELFGGLVATSKSLSSGTRSVIGGNAPVMANRFAREGAKVLLGSTFERSTAEVGLWKGVTLAGGESAYRKQDDIHLIMEYPAKKQWGRYQASRANRFILHSDVANAHLESLDHFQKELRASHPNLLVVGGLQMMDSFPYAEGERQRLLQRVEDMMVSTSDKTLIHFELASMSDEELFGNLVEHVIPFSDSLGMNEQELSLIQSGLLYSNLTTVADSNPRIASALDQMRDVFKHLHANPKGNGRRLSRMHVHTLAYQAIITVRGSPWVNSAPAAAKAALTAFRHTCASQEVDLDKAHLIMDSSFMSSRRDGASRIPVDEQNPVTCWQEGDFDLCLAPVLVCKKVFQTAGGGDNISASGLVVQI